MYYISIKMIYTFTDNKTLFDKAPALNYITIYKFFDTIYLTPFSSNIFISWWDIFRLLPRQAILFRVYIFYCGLQILQTVVQLHRRQQFYKKDVPVSDINFLVLLLRHAPYRAITVWRISSLDACVSRVSTP